MRFHIVCSFSKHSFIQVSNWKLSAILIKDWLFFTLCFPLQLVGRLSQEELMVQLPSFLPALFEAFGNQSADVRKVIGNCLSLFDSSYFSLYKCVSSGINRTKKWWPNISQLIGNDAICQWPSALSNTLTSSFRGFSLPKNLFLFSSS